MGKQGLDRRQCGSARKSLSNWYDEGDNKRLSLGTESEGAGEDDLGSCGSPGQRCFSPTKRLTPNYSIGDDSSRECSPQKRVAKGASSSSTLDNAEDARINTAMMQILRGICADYFENNVSPTLRIVERTQEELLCKLKDLSIRFDELKAHMDEKARDEDVKAAMAKKANTEEVTAAMAEKATKKDLTAGLAEKANVQDVTPFAKIEEVATLRADDSKAAMTHQFEAAMAQKANAVDVTPLAKIQEIATSKADASKVAMTLHFEKLVAKMDQKANAGELHAAEQKVASLSEELEALKRTDASFDHRWPGRDLKGLKTQSVSSLRQNFEPGAHKESSAKPGESFCKESDAGSDVGSEDRMSCGASAHGSLGSNADPQTKQMMKNVMAVVNTGAKTFSGEIRVVKDQLREVKSQLRNMGEHLKKAQEEGLFEKKQENTSFLKKILPIP